MLTESYIAQLGQFIWQLLLPAVPRLAWWALGLAGFCGLNLIFLAELWPHYPQAETWFTGLLVASLALLPWLAAYTAQRLMRQVRRWWRGFWWLVVVGACFGAVVSSFIVLVGAAITSTQ